MNQKFSTLNPWSWWCNFTIWKITTFLMGKLTISMAIFNEDNIWLLVLTILKNMGVCQLG